MCSRDSDVGVGTPLKKRHSLNVPLGPPSPLAPLSETTTMIVLSSSPLDSRKSTTLPTWSSLYSTYPAKTSAIRMNSRFSSSLSDSQGRTVSSSGQGWPSGPVTPGSPCGLMPLSSVSSGSRPSSFCRARIDSRIASYPLSKVPLYLSAHSRKTWCGACAASRLK